MTQAVSAAETSNNVQKELVEASNKLSGIGKNICAFLATEIPNNYLAKDNGIASINWIKAGTSLNANGAVNVAQVESSLNTLKKTAAGAALFKSLEGANIGTKYMPLTIHVGNINQILNTDAPMAFNSVVQTKASAKGIPFLVLNNSSIKKVSQTQMTVVIANELYDILGRMVAGENVAATSNYQALGIVLSDIVLNKEIAGKGQIDKNKMIATYKKAIKTYAGDVPSINYENLNATQKAALDNLTEIATAGQFHNFKALDNAPMAVDIALK